MLYLRIFIPSSLLLLLLYFIPIYLFIQYFSDIITYYEEIGVAAY